jgi:hypothetical protein
MSFPPINPLKDHITREQKKEMELFIQISLLACVGVVGFAFNSTVYISLPVQEREV